MKRTNILKIRGRDFIDKKSLVEAIQTNSGIILLSILLLLGMILGAIFARNAGVNTLEKLDFLFCSNYKCRSTQPASNTFIASLASSFIFILVCFLCGLSMWGVFLIPAIPFFRGFGLGLTAGYLYAAYGFKGVLFHIFILMPGAFICVIAILLAAKEGMLFSKKIATYAVQTDKSGHSKSLMKIYLSRFGKTIILAFAAAVIDLIVTACFASLFSF